MSLSRAEIDAWKEELRREGQSCEGFTDGVLAALVYVILRVPGIKIADLAGFEVPDEFVVGYGLDYAQKYRNMPYIGVLKPEVYAN